MPGHTAAGATMRSVAWRLLSATTAGFEGSSTVYRAPSEAEGFEADPSFTIAATHPSHLTDGSLLVWWLSALSILTGIRIWLPISSDPSTFPVRCYECQYSTNESYQSKEDPPICLDLRECLLDARYGSSDPWNSTSLKVRSFRITRQCSPDTWSVRSFRVNLRCLFLFLPACFGLICVGFESWSDKWRRTYETVIYAPTGPSAHALRLPAT